ncbi:MAG: glutamate-cysteine ligase family protein [Candidatus Woesearchaeota archaeon]
MAKPKIGLELELFLVNTDGSISNDADVILKDERVKHFTVPECTHSLIEIHTKPSTTINDLSADLYANLKTISDVSKDNGLLLLPSTTIGRQIPKKRSNSRYETKEKILGKRKRELEYHIAGLHIHIDKHVDTKNQYALFHLLDPSFVSTSSSPFIRGVNTLHNHRANTYRNVVFEKNPIFGSLYEPGHVDPETYYAAAFEMWKTLCVEKGCSVEGFSSKNTYWGPIRFSEHTIESRGSDATLPEIVLSQCALYLGFQRRMSDISIKSFTKSEHAKLVAEGISKGLESDLVHTYMHRLVQEAKKGLFQEELSFLEPLENQLRTRRTFSNDIQDFAKKTGEYTHGKISEKGAKAVRKYIAQTFFERLQ